MRPGRLRCPRRSPSQGDGAHHAPPRSGRVGRGGTSAPVTTDAPLDAVLYDGAPLLATSKPAAHTGAYYVPVGPARDSSSQGVGEALGDAPRPDPEAGIQSAVTSVRPQADMGCQHGAKKLAAEPAGASDARSAGQSAACAAKPKACFAPWPVPGRWTQFRGAGGVQKKRGRLGLLLQPYRRLAARPSCRRARGSPTAPPRPADGTTVIDGPAWPRLAGLVGGAGVPVFPQNRPSDPPSEPRA